jgi:hypothetical protein
MTQYYDDRGYKERLRIARRIGPSSDGLFLGVGWGPRL